MALPKNINESKYIDIRKENVSLEKSKEEKSFEKEGSPGNGGTTSRGDSEEEDDKEQQENSGKIQSQLSAMLSGVSVQEKGCFQDINLYKIFKGDKLSELWKLWEIVLTNQPLILVADLPSECRLILHA